MQATGIGAAATEVLEATLLMEPLIAVVEDDPFVRESIGRLLKSLGYNAAVFSSAADFLDSTSSGESACLIADIHMPGITGIELHRRLIEAGRPIPTIFITAYPGAAGPSPLRDKKVCYLYKPFAEQDLIDCIQCALASGKPAGESP